MLDDNHSLPLHYAAPCTDNADHLYFVVKKVRESFYDMIKLYKSSGKYLLISVLTTDGSFKIDPICLCVECAKEFHVICETNYMHLNLPSKTLARS